MYYVYFATKQVIITKREDVTNLGFCKHSNENSVFGKSLISTYSIFWGGGRGRGWGVGGCLLTSSAFRMGAYSGWVLIRG